jgi:2-polyprenyl-6-methoxyphenol hydroxylase-like FAD-dependent oxidoreductase
MNPGLEDTRVLAELAQANRLSDYDRRRRPIDWPVVGQVERLSHIMAAESLWYRFVRALLFPVAARIAFIRSGVVATLTGLDHPLAELSATRHVDKQLQGAGSV